MSTSARDIATSAYAQAKAAAEMARLHDEALNLNAEYDKLMRHETEYRESLPVLAVLFPGVEWVWTTGEDYGGYDTIMYDASESWPPSFKLRVVRRLIDMNEPSAGHRIDFEVGDYRTDTSPGTEGYRYFSGSKVKNAADVGRYLEACEK